MVPTASEEWTGLANAGPGPVDPLRRVVHVALAIYLLPVVVIVCAIGGVAIVVDRASRLAARPGEDRARDFGPGPHAAGGPAEMGSSRPGIRARRRARVGH